jgi:hypothetical protein
MKKYEIPVVNGLVIIVTVISLLLAVPLIENEPIIDRFAGSLPSRQTVYIFNFIIAASATGTALFLQIKKDSFTSRQLATILAVTFLGLLASLIYSYRLGCCDNPEAGYGFPVAVLASFRKEISSISGSQAWLLDSLFWFNTGVLSIGRIKIKKLTPAPYNRMSLFLLLLQLLVILIVLVPAIYVFFFLISSFLNRMQ